MYRPLRRLSTQKVYMPLIKFLPGKGLVQGTCLAQEQPQLVSHRYSDGGISTSSRPRNSNFCLSCTDASDHTVGGYCCDLGVIRTPACALSDVLTINSCYHHVRFAFSDRYSSLINIYYLGSLNHRVDG